MSIPKEVTGPFKEFCPKWDVDVRSINSYLQRDNSTHLPHLVTTDPKYKQNRCIFGVKNTLMIVCNGFSHLCESHVLWDLWECSCWQKWMANGRYKRIISHLYRPLLKAYDTIYNKYWKDHKEILKIWKAIYKSFSKYIWMSANSCKC